MFDITKVFKNIVIYYSELLGGKYPRSEKAVKLVEGEEVKIALIINTAEYCRHTLGEMEDTIKNSIDLDYVDQIDLYDEQQLFTELIGRGIQCLMSGIETRLEPYFTTM